MKGKAEDIWIACICALLHIMRIVGWWMCVEIHNHGMTVEIARGHSRSWADCKGYGYAI